MLVLVWASRVIVAGIFLIATYEKLKNPLHFAEQIRAYQLIPPVYSNALAFVIPPIELVTAVLLLVGLWRFEARLIIIGMLVVFTIAKTSLEVRGINIDCGCLGGGAMAVFEKAMHGVWGILFNFALLMLLFVDWVGSRTECRKAKAE